MKITHMLAQTCKHALYFTLRQIIKLVLKVAYNFSVEEREDEKGNGSTTENGVLLLGNHVSYIDFMFIVASSKQPVHFVAHDRFFECWYLKLFFKLTGAIPISKENYKASLERIGEHLKKGETVCLFPEGQLTRNGQLNTFRKGYQIGLEGTGGEIKPFYIDGLWGSRFSHAKQNKRKLLSARREVKVVYGENITDSIEPENLRQVVRDLANDAWEEKFEAKENLAAHWISQLPVAMPTILKSKSNFLNRKTMSPSFSVADEMLGELSQRKLLAGSIAFGSIIDNQCEEQNIGILLPSSVAGAMINMAVMMKGKTVVNLNYTASVAAMASAIEQAEIKTVVTSALFLKRLEAKGFQLDEALQQANVITLESLKTQVSTSRKLFSLCQTFLPKNLLTDLICRKVPEQTPAAILFSSGSEGNPKGICLSHQNILANVNQIHSMLDPIKEDVIVGALPLFHAMGFTVTTLMPLLKSIPVVWHPDPTDAVRISEIVAQYRGTVLFSTSSLLGLYTRNRKIKPLQLESLRFVLAGAERLNRDVREAFQLKFGVSIYEGFGATETAPVSTVNIPDALLSAKGCTQYGSKVGTVGMPLPGSCIRVVNPSDFTKCSANEDGMVLVSGPQVMVGYLNAPEKTEASIVYLKGKRWYVTGDKGHLDREGFLTIVDRFSRFAKIGGEMVSLTNVEDQMIRHLKDYAEQKISTEEVTDDIAAEVGNVECVAVSLPDPKKGEKIVAMINRDISLDVVKSKLLANDCHPLMIPSTVIPVDTIPKLGSGKTDFVTAKKLAEATQVLKKIA